jgi:hypothetical protein
MVALPLRRAFSRMDSGTVTGCDIGNPWWFLATSAGRDEKRSPTVRPAVAGPAPARAKGLGPIGGAEGTSGAVLKSMLLENAGWLLAAFGAAGKALGLLEGAEVASGPPADPPRLEPPLPKKLRSENAMSRVTRQNA